MLATTTGPYYRFCMQCTDAETGKVGDFLRDTNGKIISPVFGDYLAAIKWMKQNGFSFAEQDTSGENWDYFRVEKVEL